MTKKTRFIAPGRQAGRQAGKAIESDRMPEKGPEKANRSVLCEGGTRCGVPLVEHRHAIRSKVCK
jgi:hypothetical protein